jgi:DNA-directed RNA polymerase specialized sigma24 family protein
MPDHLSLTDLVTRARNGDTRAWDALVDRYAPLIWSICRRYQLADADASRAGHSVWAQLADQLDTIRDPAALPGWLATTTRRECGRTLRAAQGTRDAALAPDAQIVAGDHATAAEQELPMAERHEAVRRCVPHTRAARRFSLCQWSSNPTFDPASPPPTPHNYALPLSTENALMPP